MFYKFDQNNSGGSFKFTENLGVLVIIEADNHYKANEKFVEMGGYFNGCDDGIDCDCCGDRWYACSEADATKMPLVYGRPPQEYVLSQWFTDWTGGGTERYNIIVHYKDGRIERF